MKKCVYARCKREMSDDAVFCPYCGRRQQKDPAKKKKRRRERGSGCVYKMSGDRNKPWTARYNGKSIGGCYCTKREAENALEALLSARRPDLFNYTLEDVYNAWSSVAYRDMGTSSKRSNTLAWKHVPESLRRSTAREIRTDDFQEVVDEMQSCGLSDSSASKVKNLYSSLCKWMMQRDLISQNYAQFLHIARTDHREPDPFTVEEVSRVNALACGNPEDRSVQTAMLTMIMMFTGMRIGELFSLRVDGVHLDSKLPYIKGGIKTKAGKNRIVPVHQRIFPFLEYFCNSATGELLISGYSGRHTENGWRANDYKSMLERLGIPYKVPHNTRKTAATNAAQEGMDQLAMLRIFGWTDFSIANEYYIAPDVAYLAKEMDKLDAWSKRLDNEQKD